MLRRSALIAIVVGTILTAINQCGVFARRPVVARARLEAAADLAVPFIVATLGALGTGKVPHGR
jgi:hypothetical protein